MGWLCSPLHQGGLPWAVASLGERWVQEKGMEKRVLLVLFSHKSHTSCSESQKGIWCWHECTHRERQEAGPKQIERQGSGII